MRKESVFKIYLEKYIWVLFAAIIVYLPMIVQELPNPDTLGNGLTYKDSYDWEDCLGRWGLRYIAKLKGYTIDSELVTIFSLFILSLIVMIVCEALKIEQKWLIIIISLLLVISLNIADLLTYYYCSDAYMLAYLFAMLAIFMSARNNTILSWIIPPLLICLSYSIYQAYISNALVFALMIVIVDSINSEIDVKELLGRIVKMMVAGGVGTLLYLIITKILHITGIIALTDGRGFSQMGNLGGVKNIFSEIISTYILTIEYYFSNIVVNQKWLNKRVFIGLLVLVTAVVIIFVMRVQTERKSKWIVLIAAICLLPIGLFCEEIYAPSVSVFDSTGILILPAMNYVFILSGIIISKINLKSKVINKAIMYGGESLICVITIIMLLQVGIFQNCMKSNIEIADTIANSILSEIQQIDGAQDCRLVICGKPEYGMQDELDIVKGTVASYGIAWDGENGSGWWNFFRHYKHYEYNNCDVRTVEKAIMPTQEYIDMPVYPNKGYVWKTDDLIIVKLGE